MIEDLQLNGLHRLEDSASVPREDIGKPQRWQPVLQVTATQGSTGRSDGWVVKEDKDGEKSLRQSLLWRK